MQAPLAPQAWASHRRSINAHRAHKECILDRRSKETYLSRDQNTLVSLLWREENNRMENNTNTPLPEGVALVETYDGRWFPAFAPLTDVPQVVVLVGPSLIPPALEPLADLRQGYRCREEAIAAYCA